VQGTTRSLMRARRRMREGPGQGFLCEGHMSVAGYQRWRHARALGTSPLEGNASEQRCIARPHTASGGSSEGENSPAIPRGPGAHNSLAPPHGICSIRIWAREVSPPHSCAHAHAHAHAHTHMHARTRARTHARALAQTRAQAHTYTHQNTHAHTKHIHTPRSARPADSSTRPLPSPRKLRPSAHFSACPVLRVCTRRARLCVPCSLPAYEVCGLVWRYGHMGLHVRSGVTRASSLDT
jgi:hypothetical protein